MPFISRSDSAPLVALRDHQERQPGLSWPTGWLLGEENLINPDAPSVGLKSAQS